MIYDYRSFDIINLLTGSAEGREAPEEGHERQPCAHAQGRVPVGGGSI